MPPAQKDLTKLLLRWNQGDRDALEALIPVVYQDLRRLATYYLKQEDRARTLQSTALVHEVYLRFHGQDEPGWQGRAHFFAVAAKMMRRILVDHSRQKSAAKRGGDFDPEQLDEALTIPVQANIDTLLLDECLDELAAFDSRKARVVEMRFFGGLAAKDIASVLNTTEATVRRDWKIARAWLYRRMQGAKV